MFYTPKDFAREFQISTRTFRRIWRELRVPPTIPGHACHRWSERDANKLKAAWAKVTQARMKGGAA